jgi:hypothetical protein
MLLFDWILAIYSLMDKKWQDNHFPGDIFFSKMASSSRFFNVLVQYFIFAL